MKKTRKGKYKPSNPKKYKGDYLNIVFRSSWERSVMKWCDLHPSVIQWASEEVVIEYYDPVKMKMRRYYPDIWLRVRDKGGQQKVYLWQIKPFKETQVPESKRGKPKRRLLEQVATYATNQAKWKAARLFCAKRGWKFSVVTQKQIYGNKD